MSDHKCRAYQPTGAETLEKLVMDPNIPKSETEGWSCREIERLRARVGALEKTLKHVASVSHNGGLLRLSERDALIAVRRLTLEHWGREHGEVAKLTVIAALKEAKP